jgi:hypothetical protein
MPVLDRFTQFNSLGPNTRISSISRQSSDDLLVYLKVRRRDVAFIAMLLVDRLQPTSGLWALRVRHGEPGQLTGRENLGPMPRIGQPGAHYTEADSATPAKTPVCTLHLTLRIIRIIHIVLENQNLIINDLINNI